MSRLQNAVNLVAITSEVSHFFCCGIPIIFSLLSLLSTMGVMAAMPTGFNAIHEMMHPYEIPMIAVSAVILLLGWTLHFVAKRIDCHDTGCGHEPCEPKKNRSSKILTVASIMFALNLTGYFLLHS